MAERVSREHVEQVLARVGIPIDQRQELLDRVDYPADVNEVMRVFGLTRDDLVSRMGGSP
jgi:hypothetical protein